MTAERVTFRPEGGRARTIYLDRTQSVSLAGSPALAGVEVDREGEEVSGPNFDERRRIIEETLIVRRVPVVIDNTYGEFVEAAPR